MTKESNGQAVAKQEPKIIDVITSQVQNLQSTGELRIPDGYSPDNALKSAWLLLQDQMDKNGTPVLQSCSRASIMNSLMKMVIQGMSAVKNQCYFIPYGGKLTLQRSYQGSIALAKRVGDVKSVIANEIFEQDDFEFEIDNETGIKRIMKHDSKLDNIDTNKLKGAYAIVTFNDGSKYIEIMNMVQIQLSWNQGQTNGNSPAHKNFKGEMAKKTVINRALKTIINSSSDSDLFDEDEVQNNQPPHKELVKKNANIENFDFDEHEEVVDETPAKEEKPKNVASDPKVKEAASSTLFNKEPGF